MKLVSITTTCFKKLGDFTTNFTDGLNVICGENAQGKSTLLQAIGFALYGNEAVNGKEADFRTWGETRPYSSTLTFKHEGATYEAVRTKSTAKVSRDGELVANGKSECAKFVTELLGVNWKDFKTFVLSQQFSTFAVLEEGATTLNRKVEERSGITVIDRVQSLARSKAQQCELSAARLDHFTEELQSMELAIDVALSELTATQEEVDSHKDTEPKFEATEPSEKPTDPNTLLKIKYQRDGISRRIAEATDNEVNTREHLLFLSGELHGKTREQMDAAYQEAKSAADTAYEHLQTLNVELTSTKNHIARMESINKRVGELEQQIIPMLQKGDEASRRLTIQSFHEKVGQLTESINDAAVQLAKQKSDKADLESTLNNSVCPTCHQAIHDVDVEAVQTQIKVAAAAIDVLEQNRARLLEQSQATTRNISDWTRELDQLERLQEEHTRASEEFESGVAIAIARREELEDAIEAHGPKVQPLKFAAEEAYKALQEFSRIEAEYLLLKDKPKQISDEIDSMNAELSALPDASTAAVEKAQADWTAWQNEQRAYQELRSQYELSLSAYERKLAVLENELLHQTSKVESIQKRIEDATKGLEERKLLTEAADRYKRLGKYLGDRRAAYLADVWGQVMAVASAYVSSATDGRISSIMYEDGGFKYEENGLTPSVANASGAQLAFIGIAIRIGLSRVLYGDNSLLIFDEPTESMSESNAASVVGALATSAKQVIVITHKSTDQELAKNVIAL